MDRQCEEVRIVGVDWGCYKDTTRVIAIKVSDQKCALVGMDVYDSRESAEKILDQVTRFVEESEASAVASDSSVPSCLLLDRLKSMLWEKKLDVSVTDYALHWKLLEQLYCHLPEIECPKDRAIISEIRNCVEQGLDHRRLLIDGTYPYYFTQPLALAVWDAVNSGKMGWLCHV